MTKDWSPHVDLARLTAALGEDLLATSGKELRHLLADSGYPVDATVQEVRDSLGRRVRTVRRAERVVDVDVAAVSELTRELGVVLRLARVEARVLEHPEAVVGQ